ncbi:hemagglutinin [Actinomyces haliotis]|uniref:hemagglutinin n=1 Tax=Actinomyces haliotis TaxID=1280843 RepID=UPI002B264D92|nr:hemagglutinin [Actinomyces haliotis]
MTVLAGVVAVRLLHDEEPGAVATASPTLTAPVPIELDMAGWDATRIIDDDVFFDATTMTQAQVAALIDKVNTGCRAGRDGTPCLADATFTTKDVAATTYCPGGYAGASKESAAAVVSKVAASCDVNPQVLLTLLQKEQGLLTASGSQLTASDYEIATGYGCPDGSDCDPQYEGFFNQVYGAASQFQHYRLSPGSFEVVAGQAADIAYSPDSACGSAPLTVENEATAGLYNYTPYQPDAAAADGGDDCTSWGNWNFYGFFRALFGDPTPST